MNIELLISLVKQNESLYDKKNSNFSNYKFKSRVWQNIAKELNTEASQCKKKWNFLRNKFSKIWKKMEVNYVINNQEIAKWIHFDSLMFLKDHIVLRKYTGIDCGIGEFRSSNDIEMSNNESNKESHENIFSQDENKNSTPKETNEVSMWNVLNMIKTKLNIKEEFFYTIDHFCNMIKSIIITWPRVRQYETIMHITNYILEKEIKII